MNLEEIEKKIEQLEGNPPFNKEEIANTILKNIPSDNQYINIVERLVKLGGVLYLEDPLELDKLKHSILSKQEKFFIHFSNQLNLSQKQLEKYIDSMIVNNTFDAFKHLKSLNFDYSYNNQNILTRCATFGRTNFLKYLIEENQYQWTTKAFCNVIKATTTFDYRNIFYYLTSINKSDILLSIGLHHSYSYNSDAILEQNCIFKQALEKGANPNHKYIINHINKNEKLDLYYVQLLLEYGINPTKLHPINKEATNMVKPYLEKYNLYHKLDSNIPNKEKINKTKI